ncbi:MAG: hypothetical protein R3Y33_04760 [Clostridia bacterium]
MEYFYAVMWLAIAFMLIFKMSKENKIFYMLGAYFAIMGIWWIADAQTPELDLFSGTYGLILKLLGGVCLVITAIFYYKNIYKKRK